MGFLNFLKAKKGQKKEEFEPTANLEQLPQLSSESELYSELPNLPEAPETPGPPEIELPQPLKGLGGFDFPEGMEGGTGKKEENGNAETRPAARYGQHKPAEQLMPEWPKAREPKLPELQAMPEAPEEKPWENIPADVPELKMQIGSSRLQDLHIPHSGIVPGTEPKPDFRGGLISHKNSFFLKSDDFRTVKEDIDKIIIIQKKHHRLTEIKKEENTQFEHMSVIIEDAQRKLMHLDRTLFE